MGMRPPKLAVAVATSVKLLMAARDAATLGVSAGRLMLSWVVEPGGRSTGPVEGTCTEYSWVPLGKSTWTFRWTPSIGRKPWFVILKLVGC